MVNLGSLGRSSTKTTPNQPPTLPDAHSNVNSSSPVKAKPNHFPSLPKTGYIPYIPPRSGSFPSTTVQDQSQGVIGDPFARRSSGQADSIYDRHTLQPSSTTVTSPTVTATQAHRPTSPRRSKEHAHASSQRKNHHRREYSVTSLDRQVVDSSQHHHRSERDRNDTSRYRTTSKATIIITKDEQPYSHPTYPYSDRKEPTASASSIDFAAPSSPEKSTTDLPNLIPPHRRPSSAMRPSPLNPNPLSTPGESGYDTSSSAPESLRRTGRSNRHVPTHDILSEMPEMGEASDTLGGLPRESSVPGVLALGMGFTNGNYSSASVGSKFKTDKVLGLDPNAKLASFYLVSGLPRDYPDWSPADVEATRGLHPSEDSLGMFWRPDVLGSAFSGQKTEDWLKDMQRARKDSKTSVAGSQFGTPLVRNLKGIHVPDAGPHGPEKVLTKTLKYAHPRDVEVINSTLCPPTTCHAFTFTLPKHDTLATIARTKLDSAVNNHSKAVNYNAMLSPEDTTMSFVGAESSEAMGGMRNMARSTELTFHGVTLTVWTHADRERGSSLKRLKERRERIKNGLPDSSMRSNTPVGRAATEKPKSGKQRTSLPWGLSRKSSVGEMSASETETGMIDSDLEGPLGRRQMRNAMFDSRGSIIESLADDTARVFDDGGDVFWMPYAITLISRHPIYDFMQDYLRLSWARYSKNAQHHMSQVCRLLNQETPRPGDLYRMNLTNGMDQVVTVEATMPGALDFDRGIVSKVDFQMWPMFQALDIDHILTCLEVALSNSGRFVFCSKHPAMLNVCVSSIKFLVELRGWDGVALPIIHARDMNFVIEDPGPYIIGMPTECRYMVTMPGEVVIVDIDTNSLTCASPPVGIITPRKNREKAKHRIFAAFGPGLPVDKSIPMEFKVSYPRGTFRNINKFEHGSERPTFLGERLRAPRWWQYTEVVSAFDKIMANKSKKPSLIQRLTKSGMTRPQAAQTATEVYAKLMMRRRALHYVETRDSIEVKVGKINRRLQKLVQEGEHWKKQFEKFEMYADQLTQEANDLKTKIEREKREAKRLSNIATEKSKANAELEEKLVNTETARAEAMRQLSDMHHSIQELEKEREDIMNHFESQLNHALEGVAMDDESRPSTPTDSILNSPMSKNTALRGLRPATRDSERSTLSKYTVESSLSVLGAAKASAGPPGAFKRKYVKPGTASTSGKTDGDEKLDSISQRIAAIQAKLEFALSNVATRADSGSSGHGHDDTSDVESSDAQATNGLGLEGTDSIDEADSGTADTPIASRRVSHATFDDAPPLPTGHNSDSSLDVEVPPMPHSPEYHTANESPERFDIDDSTPTGTTRERKTSSSAGSINTLMRPGVTLRIKRKDDQQSLVENDVVRGGHEKLSTEDSAFSEVLISPTPSHFTLASETKGRARGGSLGSPGRVQKPALGIEEEMGLGAMDVEGEDVGDKRMSGMSDSTIAFGKVGR